MVTARSVRKARKENIDVEQCTPTLQWMKHRIGVKFNKVYKTARNSDRLTEIYENVYLGSSPNSNDDLSFITAVICMQEQHEKPANYPYFDNVLNLPTPDHASPSREQIQAAMDFIDQNKSGKILIHCKSGFGRSAVIAVAHVSRTCNMTLKEAHSYVNSRRNISSLHMGIFQNPQWAILYDFLND